MIDYTRVRLTRWGQWCKRGIPNLGYPAAAAFVHANEGDRCEWQGLDMPPDVAEVEEIVNRMSATLRMPVRIVYCTSGPLWLKAMRIGVSRRTLRRRLDHAEHWIHGQLT